MGLDEYRRKRDFGATPEPAPLGDAAGDGAPRFVVQRHSARALHFDLRLEHEGALASWAVPKGVPLRRGPKRLAVRTEDHPLEYLDFAAVIPEGQYGAGRMTVWDTGTYEPLKITGDEWKVILHGGVVEGEYHMVRTGPGDSGKEQWLLFRATAAGDGAPDPVPAFRELRPMLSSAARDPFDDPEWTFEIKWDGYRALVLVSGDGVELRSRSGRDVTADYPELGNLRRLLLCQEAILDAEICILDDQGRASFQALQRHDGTATLVVFDVLQADGRWVTDRPLAERRALLSEIVAPEAPPRLIVSETVPGQGCALYAAALERGIEGIVAKRLDSPYRPGQRSRDWVKVKARQEETVLIGGWSEGEGSRRSTLGSLLVGRPDPAGLVFTGMVGSGLTEATARDLRGRLEAEPRADSPFAAPPPPAPGVHWVEPTRWCRVAYVEMTADGRMRAPVFLGLADGPDTGEEAWVETPAAPPTGGSDERIVADGARRVRLTNLSKVYWPGEGITKGELLDHYLRVSEWLVPHLAGRPMILKRYPNGIAEAFFFQHNAPDNTPEWLPTAELGRGESSTERNRYLVVEDPLALLWVANLGCIDLNPWQSRVGTPNAPTHVLFDLDPPDGMSFDLVVETALMVRDALERLGIRGYPKTSGSTGMHVFVPVGPGLTYEVTRLFAQVVCEDLARRRPDILTTVVTVANRGNRLYLDANQNGRGRSVASVYSVRPRPGAPVSTPLEWDEVRPGLDPRAFTMDVVARRLVRHGDLFAGALDDPQPLSEAIARITG